MALAALDETAPSLRSRAESLAGLGLRLGEEEREGESQPRLVKPEKLWGTDRVREEEEEGGRELWRLRDEDPALGASGAGPLAVRGRASSPEDDEGEVESLDEDMELTNHDRGLSMREPVRERRRAGLSLGAGPAEALSWEASPAAMGMGLGRRWGWTLSSGWGSGSGVATARGDSLSGCWGDGGVRMREVSSSKLSPNEGRSKSRSGSESSLWSRRWSEGRRASYW